MTTTSIYTMDFSQIGMHDVARVGGKNASLGQLFNALKPKGSCFRIDAGYFRRSSDPDEYKPESQATKRSINSKARPLYEMESLNVGQAAPLFAFKSTTGERVALSDFRGKVTLLFFWASW